MLIAIGQNIPNRYSNISTIRQTKFFPSTQQSNRKKQKRNYQQATIDRENAIAEPLGQEENVGHLTVIRFQFFGINRQGTSPIVGDENDDFDRE